MAYLVDLPPDARYQPDFRLDPPARVIEGDVLRNDGLSAQWRRGDLVDPDLLPRRAVQTSRHKSIPDFFPLDWRWCVSEAVRALVEAREPGVHQFIPIELVPKSPVKGEPAQSLPYYFFNIRQRLDAVIVERSSLHWSWLEPVTQPNPDGTTTVIPGAHVMHLPPTLLPPDPYPVVVDRQAVAGRHVWRGESQLMSSVFFSDDLMAAVRAAKLKQLRAWRLAEEDRTMLNREGAFQGETGPPAMAGPGRHRRRGRLETERKKARADRRRHEHSGLLINLLDNVPFMF